MYSVKVGKDTVIFKDGDLVVHKLTNKSYTVGKEVVYFRDGKSVVNTPIIGECLVDYDGEHVPLWEFRFVSKSSLYERYNILLEIKEKEVELNSVKSFLQNFDRLTKKANRRKERLEKMGLHSTAISAQLRVEFPKLYMK
jgi:hypothetical protein